MDTFDELTEQKRSPNIFVIPGTKKAKSMEDHLAAANVRLGKEDEAELRKVVSEAGFQGGRGPFFFWLLRRHGSIEGRSLNEIH